MMLDINFVELREGFQKYMPLGLGVAGLLLAELCITVFARASLKTDIVPMEGPHNTAAIGLVLYTDYVYLFQLAGLILLVAMIGAITLTLRKREGVRKQVIQDQNSRKRAQSVEVVSVETGKGVGKS